MLCRNNKKKKKKILKIDNERLKFSLSQIGNDCFALKFNEQPKPNIID